jgi:RNA polymerase sigma-70 factor (ECF subfamily)
MNAFSKPIADLREVAEWVRAAQAGDREAFGRLFERYRYSILAVLSRRLKDEHVAQELSQDVFVQALQKIDQLRTPECFGAWLRRIAVRMAINHQQRNRAATAVDPSLAESTVVDECDPVEFALRDERALQVRGGLARLRPMDRQTLVAFYVRGQSLSEMAGEFAAPIGTIKRRLHMARKRLAAAIG